MPIQEQNIVFVESQVMDDVPEGGGAATGHVIEDGAMNNVFEDISDLDRAYGRFNLRKIFLAVRTLSTDLYGGAKTVITALPQDDALGYALFSSNDPFDTRAQAADKVESYLYKGPTWPGYLYENHITGMRAISVIQRVGTELPPIGRTLCLVADEGLPNEKEQYVRVTKVEVVEREFTDAAGQDGTFTRWVATYFLSDALRFDFDGHTPSRYDRDYTYTTGKARIRDTTVADATRYYGAQRLQTSAAIGDVSVRAASIFTRLVPSAQTELPVAAALPHAAAATPVPGTEAVTYTATHTWSPEVALHLPGGVLPGSLSITTDGITIYDDAGALRTSSGEVGAIDYANGVLTLASGSSSSSGKTITYRPAAQVQRAPQSSEIPITQETRGLSYTGQVVPLPQPGTLVFSFRSQGRWYVLQEQGNGAIAGQDASLGAGTFDPNSGGFTLTLGALPDVGSSVVLTWNVPTQETPQPAAALKASQTIGLDLGAAEMVQPGSLTLSWMEGATPKTATAGTNLALTGAATGRIIATGEAVEFAPNTLPAVGAQITVDYTVGPKQEDAFAHPARDGQGKVPVTATLGAIAPGTLEVEWNTVTDEAVLGVYTRDQIREMGIGIAAPVDPIHIARDDGTGNVVLNGTNVGTVNYATGAVLFNPDLTIMLPTPQYGARRLGFVETGPFTIGGDGTIVDIERFRLNYGGISYTSAPTVYPNDTSGFVKLRYNAPGATTARQKVVTFEPSFRLVPGVAAQVVPGSVVLRFGASGAPIGDNGQGVLREPITAGYAPRGVLDYVGGTATLSTWAAGTENTIVRAACVTTVGEAVSSAYVFRTVSAPLRPGSLSISYATSDTGPSVATADVGGAIIGSGVLGTVDYETGIVRIAFGSRVLAAGNEAEPWYDARLVEEDGKIFKPKAIAMSTVRYSSVSYAYLPLDADILGIDPVRLPSDGRVPIYRAGDVAMVMHTDETAPQTVTNGGTIDCGRSRIGWIRVLDANGASVPSGYTLDRATGIVTFSDVAGIAMPVTVRHTVGDLRQITDAQITGQLTFARPLTHDYPAGESLVASCLIHGDRRARVSAAWDQATWDGTWTDALKGSEATATLDTIAHPIEVTNEGAETERWLLRWTSTTNVELIGQRRGLVFSGPFTADIAPINPRTRNTDGTGGAPYLRIPLAANGGGWSAGNVVRINTVGALADIWIARSIQQSDEPLGDGEDGVELYALGNIDRP